MKGSVAIHVLVPLVGIRVLAVNPSDRISVLDSVLGIPQLDLIFNGQLVNPAASFETYNIQQNDCLVAVQPCSDRGALARRWIKLTDESDEFATSVQCIINPTCRHELFRLRDIRRMRLEARPRTLKRLSAALDRSSRSLEVVPTETVVPKPPTAVSCEPLPELWRRE
jgi:hypothetical protein